MDKMDMKILLELDKNPRASFNAIGKAARISKEVAQYRFKKLLRQNIITGFFAYINTSKLGYVGYKILIKYKSVTREIQNAIIQFVHDNKQISWAASCDGAWDLMITISSASSFEFKKLYTDFFERFGMYFKEKNILMPINYAVFNDKYLSSGKFTYCKKVELQGPVENLDLIDKTILFELSENARIPFTDIGKKCGLSYWAIAKRYKKLLKKGIIIVLKPRINFRKLGYSYYHIFIELNNEKIKEKVVSYYLQEKRCIHVVNHVGFYALHLEFVMNSEDINEILLDMRERFGEYILTYEPISIAEEYIMSVLRKNDFK